MNDELTVMRIAGRHGITLKQGENRVVLQPDSNDPVDVLECDECGDLVGLVSVSWDPAASAAYLDFRPFRLLKPFSKLVVYCQQEGPPY